jgi:hypothetical protein
MKRNREKPFNFEQTSFSITRVCEQLFVFKPCPANFYQPAMGQQRCLQCANNTFTGGETGRFHPDHCLPMNCTQRRCQNRGSCVVKSHRVKQQAEIKYNKKSICKIKYKNIHKQMFLNNLKHYKRI